MYNILEDINHLFYRWVHVLSAQNKNFLTKPEDKDILVKDVFFSIFNDINRYRGCMSRLIFAVDSKTTSWRKSYLTTYKGTRKKEYDFDYGLFHEALNEFCDFCEQLGIIVLRCDYAEGDDLIAIASDLLFQHGESSIILSGDSDLRQLVKNDDNNLIAIFDPDPNRKYHYISDYFHHESKTSGRERTFEDLLDDEPDLADMKNTWLNIVFDGSVKVDPFGILMVKIMSGDKGDNVPSTYLRMQKNEKMVGFGETSANNLYLRMTNEMTFNHDYIYKLYENEKERRDLASRILDASKSKELHKIGEIADNIKRNITMVYLNKLSYNEVLYEDFSSHINSSLFDEEKLANHKAVVNKFYPKILSGTKYSIESESRQE